MCGRGKTATVISIYKDLLTSGFAGRSQQGTGIPLGLPSAKHSIAGHQ
jgi:hypothetical protein